MNILLYARHESLCYFFLKINEITFQNMNFFDVPCLYIRSISEAFILMFFFFMSTSKLNLQTKKFSE